MPELASNELPQASDMPTPPDIALINGLSKLEAKREKIEERMKTAGEDERKVLEMEKEILNKQIDSFHDSFGVYRNRVQSRERDETAEKILGKDLVDDANKFKKIRPRKSAEN